MRCELNAVFDYSEIGRSLVRRSRFGHAGPWRRAQQFPALIIPVIARQGIESNDDRPRNGVEDCFEFGRYREALVELRRDR